MATGTAGTQGIRGGFIEIANGDAEAGYAHLQEAGINFTALGVARVLHVRHVRKTLNGDYGKAAQFRQKHSGHIDEYQRLRKQNPNMPMPAQEALRLAKQKSKWWKFRWYTEDELLSAPSHLKIPDVEIIYVDDLMKTKDAYGLYQNGKIYIQSGMKPSITKGSVRHEYVHLRYEKIFPRLSRLYSYSNIAEVAEEFGAQFLATRNLFKGLQFSGRYINPIRFGGEVVILTAAGYAGYQWWFND